jgi:hypothetical protein
MHFSKICIYPYPAEFFVVKFLPFCYNKKKSPKQHGQGNFLGIFEKSSQILRI